MAEEHPWLKGRAEMDRMYLDMAEHRRAWMTAAMVSMAATAVLAAALVYMTVNHSSAPYLVEVDNLGETRVVEQIATQEVPIRVQQTTLRRVLVNLRQVPTDGRLLTAQFDVVQAHLAGSAADTFREDWQMSADELSKMIETGARRYVTSVRSVLPFPQQPGLYRVTWSEETIQQGAKDIKSYEGHFQVAVMRIDDPRVVVENPMGVFITDYSIALLTEDESET